MFEKGFSVNFLLNTLSLRHLYKSFALGILIAGLATIPTKDAVAKCIKGDCESGCENIQTWESGHKYEGCYENGLRNGWGKMIQANGNFHEGNWIEDGLNGEVIYTYTNDLGQTISVLQLWEHGKFKHQIKNLTDERRRKEREKRNRRQSTPTRDHGVREFHGPGKNCGICDPSGRTICTYEEDPIFGDPYWTSTFGGTGDTAEEAAVEGCKR